jgi:hypothetical protein
MIGLYNGDIVLCVVQAKAEETAALNITIEPDRF